MAPVPAWRLAAALLALCWAGCLAEPEGERWSAPAPAPRSLEDLDSAESEWVPLAAPCPTCKPLSAAPTTLLDDDVGLTPPKAPVVQRQIFSARQPSFFPQDFSSGSQFFPSASPQPKQVFPQAPAAQPASHFLQEIGIPDNLQQFILTPPKQDFPLPNVQQVSFGQPLLPFSLPNNAPPPPQPPTRPAPPPPPPPQPLPPANNSAQDNRDQKEEVQLLYVPVETLRQRGHFNQQQRFPTQQPQPSQLQPQQQGAPLQPPQPPQQPHRAQSHVLQYHPQSPQGQFSLSLNHPTSSQFPQFQPQPQPQFQQFPQFQQPHFQQPPFQQFQQPQFQQSPFQQPQFQQPQFPAFPQTQHRFSLPSTPAPPPQPPAQHHFSFVQTPPQTAAPPPTAAPTTTPAPHQPPLSVYMSPSGAHHDTKITDVLQLLKNARTIPVLDNVTPDSPQVFVGPANLQPPKGYAKFELPYLSSLDTNRVERKVNKLPFFVAPLSFQPPAGYSKILLPPPHIGSVVVNSNVSATPAPVSAPQLHDKDVLVTKRPPISSTVTFSLPSEITPVNPRLPTLVNSLDEGRPSSTADFTGPTTPITPTHTTPRRNPYVRPKVQTVTLPPPTTTPVSRSTSRRPFASRPRQEVATTDTPMYPTPNVLVESNQDSSTATLASATPGQSDPSFQSQRVPTAVGANGKRGRKRLRNQHRLSDAQQHIDNEAVRSSTERAFVQNGISDSTAFQQTLSPTTESPPPRFLPENINLQQQNAIFSSEKPNFSERPAIQSDRPNFIERPAFQSERPSFQEKERPNASERPAFQQSERPNFSERPSFQQQTERPNFSDRPSFQQTDRPNFSERPSISQTDRPNFSEHHSFIQTDRPNFSERPVFHQTERPTFSERPVFQQTERPNFSERPTFKLTSRPNFSDRPVFQQTEMPSFSERPSSQQPDGPSFSERIIPQTDRPNFSDRPALQLTDRPTFGEQTAVQTERPNQVEPERPVLQDGQLHPSSLHGFLQVAQQEQEGGKVQYQYHLQGGQQVPEIQQPTFVRVRGRIHGLQRQPEDSPAEQPASLLPHVPIELQKTVRVNPTAPQAEDQVAFNRVRVQSQQQESIGQDPAANPALAVRVRGKIRSRPRQHQQHEERPSSPSPIPDESTVSHAPVPQRVEDTPVTQVVSEEPQQETTQPSTSTTRSGVRKYNNFVRTGARRPLRPEAPATTTTTTTQRPRGTRRPPQQGQPPSVRGRVRRPFPAQAPAAESTESSDQQPNTPEHYGRRRGPPARVAPSAISNEVLDSDHQESVQPQRGAVQLPRQDSRRRAPVSTSPPQEEADAEQPSRTRVRRPGHRRQPQGSGSVPSGTGSDQSQSDSKLSYSLDDTDVGKDSQYGEKQTPSLPLPVTVTVQQAADERTPNPSLEAHPTFDWSAHAGSVLKNGWSASSTGSQSLPPIEYTGLGQDQPLAQGEVDAKPSDHADDPSDYVEASQGPRPGVASISAQDVDNVMKALEEVGLLDGPSSSVAPSLETSGPDEILKEDIHKKAVDPSTQKKGSGTGAGRRRGNWVRVRVKRPRDSLATAESQNSGSFPGNVVAVPSGSDFEKGASLEIKETTAFAEEVPALTTTGASYTEAESPDVSTPRISSLSISSAVANVPEEEDTVEDSNKASVVDQARESEKQPEQLTSTSEPTFIISTIIPVTTSSAEDADSHRISTTTSTPEPYEEATTTVTTTTLGPSQVKQQLKKQQEQEQLSKFLGSTTSTKVSMETEICFRGRCIKTKGMKDDSHQPSQQADQTPSE